MKLLNATPSPYGRKIAIALREKSIPYEVFYDVPWNEGTVTPNYSPLQQLPILITDEGEHIYDSSYILDWLERRHPSPALWPADDDGYLKARLLQVLGERLMDINTVALFEMARSQPSQSWLARQVRKLGTGLAELDRLAQDRRPAPDAPITLGDIAACTTLTMFEFLIEQGAIAPLPELLWRTRFPRLGEYVAALEARPSFRATLPTMQAVDIRAVVD